jgi:hypothetical protein
VRLVATVAIAVVVFPFEVVVALVGGGNEVRIASDAIRSLWRTGPDGPSEESDSSRA